MRQLLNSLLNATVLLAIILLALLLWFSYKVEDLAANLVTQVDMSVIEAAEADIGDAIADIHALQEDLSAINTQLTRLIDNPEISLSPESQRDLESINAHAERIDQAVTRLTHVDKRLSDNQIREIGKALAEVVINIRDCRRGDSGA